MEDVDKLLSSGKSVDYVYNKILDNSGSPYLSTSQSHEPSDKKQIYNRKYLIQLQEKGTEDKDELLEGFKQLKNNPILESLVFKQDSYYIFVSMSKLINDIEMFCSKDENGSVLTADTTYNLYNLWVTDTSYRNQRLVRTNTRKHPMFLGPLFFHFTTDVTTFSRFAFEIKPHGITKDIRIFGVDLEAEIWQGLKQIFQSSKPYTVPGIYSKGIKKIEKLLSKTHSNAAEKSKAKSEILKVLYGFREGGIYKYGLSESEI